VFGTEASPTAYQAPPQPVSTYTPAPGLAPAQNNKYTQYVLYGCGCLLLMCICSLLAVAAWALIDPSSFENLTGIDIALKTIELYPPVF
jgi:hypothetical protein